MSDNKKYYWLKLKRDFFKRHDVRIIEEMPNGKEYVLFYLKLLLESIDHEGALRFSEAVPYNEQMLSVVTNTSIDIVGDAMKVFTELRMIEILGDKTIFLHEVQKLTGSETAKAELMRKKRSREKLASGNNVTEALPLVTKCYTEIEKEKDIEKDIDIEIEGEEEKENTACSPSPLQVVELYNKICISFPPVRTLSEARKKEIAIRLNTYSLKAFETLFENAESSSFLKGSNPRNWYATFDWLINEANMIKVIEGNYADRNIIKEQPKSDFDDFMSRLAAMRTEE